MARVVGPNRSAGSSSVTLSLDGAVVVLEATEIQPLFLPVAIAENYRLLLLAVTGSYRLLLNIRTLHVSLFAVS